MKFYLMVAIAAIFMVNTVSAQDVHIGFKGGLNVYNINTDDNYSFDSKLGLHAGLLGHIHITDRFAIQPEVMYSGQGARYQNFNSRLNLHYVNVPVLFQLMFGNGFRIHAGPQAGFLIKAKFKNDDVSLDYTDNYKTLDLGLSLGGSYLHTASGFGIDARYTHGLSNINDSGSTRTSNRGFQLGLFYLFGHRS